MHLLAKLVLVVLTLAALAPVAAVVLVALAVTSSYSWAERHVVFKGDRKAQTRAAWRSS